MPLLSLNGSLILSMSPAHLGPTEKERKYDRQLRLWAATGQAALESANVLLINSGAGTVGTETLKNLVLPGLSANPFSRSLSESHNYLH